MPQPQRRQVQEQFNLQFASIVGANVGHDQDAYGQYLVSLADIQLTDQCLGQGFSGKVYRAILPQLLHRATGSLSAFSPACETGTIVALKVITSAGGNGRVVEGCSADNDAIVRSALLEARLHARLEHPNLVRLLAVQEARQPVMIALELCEHGALLGVLRERSGSELDDFNGEQRRDMATQVAAGLRCLHSKLCIHRDIAARNVLVAAALGDVPPPLCGYTMKLSDLGLARQLRTEKDYYQVRVPLL